MLRKSGSSWAPQTLIIRVQTSHCASCRALESPLTGDNLFLRPNPPSGLAKSPEVMVWGRRNGAACRRGAVGAGRREQEGRGWLHGQADEGGQRAKAWSRKEMGGGKQNIRKHNWSRQGNEG